MTGTGDWREREGGREREREREREKRGGEGVMSGFGQGVEGGGKRGEQKVASLLKNICVIDRSAGRGKQRNESPCLRQNLLRPRPLRFSDGSRVSQSPENPDLPGTVRTWSQRPVHSAMAARNCWSETLRETLTETLTPNTNSLFMELSWQREV